MVLTRVFERQFDQNDRPIIITNKDKYGVVKPTSQAKIYYMDLSQEEENILRETARFSFESMRDYEIKDISQKELEDGSERKTIVVDFWADPKNKRV